MSETGSWTQYQKLVLRLLEQHDEKLEALKTQLTDYNTDRAIISENVAALKADVDLLLEMIRDGSLGLPSVLTRIDHLELDIEQLQKSVAGASEEATSLRNFKRSLFISVAGTLLVIAWNIVQLFVK